MDTSQQEDSRDFLRICTFNMQFGKPAEGEVNLDANASSNGARGSGLIQGFLAGMPSRDGLEIFAAELAQLDADVVLLQEVDDVRMRSTLIPQADLLADLLDMDRYFIPVERNVFGAPASSYLPWRGRGAYGMAILSRFPMSGCLKLALPEKTEFFRKSSNSSRGVQGWYLHVTEPRACAYAVLDIPGKPSLVFGNTHLSTNNAAARNQLSVAMRGFDVLSERNNLGDSRYVLGGDFNLGADEVEEVLADEGESDFSLRSLASELTYPRRSPEKQIDFLLGNDLNVIDTSTKEFSISDHRALIVDISL
ncbi:endonuclease/exonuclease/phosphatase family protein [Arcanobacterium ihumii]|uniref:endonuclease/exonuclease/phosphatase family protein n=1 Tax=Arcanobacterium ihumii TaxID=2138162 RepID=UPI000F543B85|nr:endonuclease/exonuclease/phosphatase family protein [Arcanobacterium ihumii]